MSSTNIEALSSDVSELNAMLENPEPGLATWRERLRELLANVADWSPLHTRTEEDD